MRIPLSPIAILLMHLKNRTLSEKILDALELEARRTIIRDGDTGIICFDKPGGEFISLEISSGDDDKEESKGMPDEFFVGLAKKIYSDVWNIPEAKVKEEEIEKIVKILKDS